MFNSQTNLQNQIILSQIPLSQIFEGFRAIIREEIKAEINAKNEAEAVNLHISEKAAREMFYPPASKSTFYRWAKAGLINKKRIGGRVVYLKSEIESAVKTLKLYKQKAR